jgi:phage shock protein A
MRFLELVVLRMLLWVGLPCLLAVLAIGPKRFGRAVAKGWNWLFRRRLEPEEVLDRVVQEHQQHVAALKQVLDRAEGAEVEIKENIERSERNVAELEEEAKVLAGSRDDLGARAVLYKLNLERAAIDTFKTQLDRQRKHIAEVRRHLYLVELQLRQYDVGRRILLSQLAEAKTLEQQASIAEKFDPFNAVANWEKAEGIVEEKTFNAKAVERVYADMAEIPLTKEQAQVDPALLDAQLEDLKKHANRQKSLER